MLERRWWSWGLQGEISRLGIDVFHGTDFAVPYLPLRPSVMTLHDLSPWLDPGWHAESDRIRNRTPMLLRLGLATMVITPSEAIRRAAIERFHLQRDRVVAVPHAASRMLFVRHRAPPRTILPISVRRHARAEKKHRLDARRVAGASPRSSHRSGPGRPPPRGLSRDSRPSPVCDCRASRPRRTCRALYSGAIACLYPSYYEGFGLPVLEAMQCGAVVIASRDPAIIEVAGDGAMLLDVGDRALWLDALRSAVEQPERDARPPRTGSAQSRGIFLDQNSQTHESRV